MANNVRPQRNALDECLQEHSEKAKKPREMRTSTACGFVPVFRGQTLRLAGLSHPNSAANPKAPENHTVAILEQAVEVKPAKVPDDVCFFALVDGNSVQLLRPVRFSGNSLKFFSVGKKRQYPVLV